MKANENLEICFNMPLKVSDSDFVTKAEMTQILKIVVQHYEKRIQSLENAYI